MRWRQRHSHGCRPFLTGSTPSDSTAFARSFPLAYATVLLHCDEPSPHDTCRTLEVVSPVDEVKQVHYSRSQWLGASAEEGTRTDDFINKFKQLQRLNSLRKNKEVLKCGVATSAGEELDADGHDILVSLRADTDGRRRRGRMREGRGQGGWKVEECTTAGDNRVMAARELCTTSSSAAARSDCPEHLLIRGMISAVETAMAQWKASAVGEDGERAPRLRSSSMPLHAASPYPCSVSSVEVVGRDRSTPPLLCYSSEPYTSHIISAGQYR
uniref:Uncharacterized protein n=1 Tax=Oryza punctata TaxID=4537 RepID=A0A0E0LA80_ORYPU